MRASPSSALLERRGLLRIAGPDAEPFLQALVSVDVAKALETKALYGALLTPQGKYLHDFFLLRLAAGFYLDCERARLEDLKTRLSRYRLRAQVTLEDASEAFRFFACFGKGALAKLDLPAEEGAMRPFAGGWCYVDPRLAAAGARALLPSATATTPSGFADTDATAYDRFRIGLGLADGSRDMSPEKSTLLEYGFDELHGIDWEKGCYVGQEVTARMKHRGLIRKRLLPVALEGGTPETGTPVRLEGREVGRLASQCEREGLALLDLAAVDDAARRDAPLLADGVRLRPSIPGWMRR